MDLPGTSSDDVPCSKKIKKEPDDSYDEAMVSSDNLRVAIKQEEDLIIDENGQGCYVWLKDVHDSEVKTESSTSKTNVPKTTKAASQVPEKPSKNRGKILKPAAFVEQHNKQMKQIADEFEAVGILWASKLRKLDETQRVLAEDLINQILKKGFFKELSKNTHLQKVI